MQVADGHPLAPLGNVSETGLPGLLRALDDRFTREAPADEAARLRVVTYTLLGLRYPPELVDRLMPGLQHMRDSATYQAILDEGRAEGRAEGEQRLTLRLGTARLGPPDDRTRARIGAITDIEALESLGEQLLVASSWDELLAND